MLGVYNYTNNLYCLKILLTRQTDVDKKKKKPWKHFSIKTILIAQFGWYIIKNVSPNLKKKIENLQSPAVKHYCALSVGTYNLILNYFTTLSTPVIKISVVCQDHISIIHTYTI